MSDNWLLAILAICMTLGFAAEQIGKHADCIAFCTNIASAGGR